MGQIQEVRVIKIGRLKLQWDLAAEGCSYTLPTAATGLLSRGGYSGAFGKFEMVGEATC